MGLIIEMLGLPPQYLLIATRDRGSRFFSCTTGQPRYMMRPGREARGPPGSRDLGLLLTSLLREQQDFHMIDFIKRCLQGSSRLQRPRPPPHFPSQGAAGLSYDRLHQEMSPGVLQAPETSASSSLPFSGS